MSSSPEQLALQAPFRGELRLVDRRAFVGFPEWEVRPGIRIVDFALQIPNVGFPFDVSVGASHYQNRKLDFGFLDVAIDAEWLTRQVAQVAARVPELEDLKLFFRKGFVEGQAKLRPGEGAPFTFKLAFDGEGDRLAAYFYDVRLYAFSPMPVSQVPVLLSKAIVESGLLPAVELKGATGFRTHILPPLALWASVGRGYKLPYLHQARLSTVEVSRKGLLLRFASGGLPPSVSADEGLLLTLEGVRAFSEAEELLAQGKLKEAREIYIKAGDLTEAHPFATERLLSLLVADPSAHEMALDVALALSRRREKSGTPFWVEGLVRERRGEHARAAERFLALCGLARARQEETGAFWAADAAARIAKEKAPSLSVQALHEVLGLRPDHLPSLKALAKAADKAQDRAGAIRAYRRIAALARESTEAAEAHVRMAQLTAQTDDDVAGARLHCEAALRLVPDQPDALMLLAELCHKAQEPLRAIKTLDRLREVALARHEVDRIGHANLLAGRVWEIGLNQLENALLRYKEAAQLLPGEPEPLYRAAAVAETLGKVQEAVAGYQQAVELAGPLPANEDIRHVAHKSHHALARLKRTKLGDASGAKGHLEAALALVPTDMAALDELIPYFRATGRVAELADACEKAARVIDEPSRRAALWAEAGELQKGRLGNADKAFKMFESALEADAFSRPALEGMLALAESRRDGVTLTRCLKTLSELVVDEKVRVQYLRRLGVAARDLTFDLELAVQAFHQVLKAEPADLASWGELCGLHRRRSDAHGLASALEQRARVAEVQGDKRLAASALRELAQVLEVRLGRVGEALVSLERAARLHNEPSILMDLANLSLRCDRPQHARHALEEMLSVLPKHTGPDRIAEIRAKLGRAFEAMGEWEAAKENYVAAFPLRSLDDELFGRLQAFYESSGQTHALAEVWATRAQALLAAARPTEAAEMLARCGHQWVKEGDHGAARARFMAALEASPTGEHVGATLDALAELEIARGEHKEAANLLARRAALLMENREAARVLFRASQLVAGEARELTFLAQALERDSKFSPALIRRAELNLSSDPRLSLADFETVLGLDLSDPDLPRPAMRLELARRASYFALKAGQLEVARKHLAFFVAHKPDDVEAVQTLASLHRHADATEALCDILGELYPRLSGKAQKDAREEFVALSIRLGRKSAAMQVLREALQADALDTESAQKLFELLPEENSTRDERLELLARLIRHASGEKKVQWLGQRAQVHREAKKWSQARADLLEASRLALQPVPILRQLAEVCQKLSDDAGELAAWKEAGLQDTAWMETAIPRVFALAQAGLGAGRFDLAHDAYSTLSQWPLSEEQRFHVFWGLSHVAQIQGENTHARAYLLEASKQGPVAKRCEALLALAEESEKANDFAEAQKSYETVLALQPRHPLAMEGLRRTLENSNNFEALAQLLTDVAVHAPRATAAGLYAQLAEVYQVQLKDASRAEEALRKVVALDANHADARIQLALLLHNKSMTVEACELIEEAAGLSEGDRAAALLRQAGGWAKTSGELDVALKLLRQAEKRAPAEGRDLFELAEVLYLRGAVKEALPIFERLSTWVNWSENPDQAENVLLRLADLAEQESQFTLAEASLRKIVEARPLQASAIERLAALVHLRSPREAIDLQVAYLKSLSPSERTVNALVAMADRVQTELADSKLAMDLLTQAVGMSDKSLEARKALVALCRKAGWTAEWMTQLEALAQLHLENGEVSQAVALLEEKASLAEASGRVDEALHTLSKMVSLSEDEGHAAWVCEFHRRRALLFSEAKQDFDAAQQALRAAFESQPKAEIAQGGRELAFRHGNAEVEMEWVERLVDVAETPEERSLALLELARFHLGLQSKDSSLHLEGAAMLGPEQAEAALNEALKQTPNLQEAEALLEALYVKMGRVVDSARHFEARAQSLEGEARAKLLLKAADIYYEQAQQPHAAAAAMVAAQAALPEDLLLTRRLADLLHTLGRELDASQYDALLLKADSFDAVFERHRSFLEKSQAFGDLADVWATRAEAQLGDEAAESLMHAAENFRKAHDEEKASGCEEKAFWAAPSHAQAFEAMKSKPLGPRERAEIYRARAEAEPAEASALFEEASKMLLSSGETLLATDMLDSLLKVAPDHVFALEQRSELAAQNGGPKASQVFDRRYLAAAGQSLPVAQRARILLRLGHASMESGAYQDAADVLTQVLDLEVDSARETEALSLLLEAHAKTNNLRGLYHVSVRLASKVPDEEAEALYRRAANLFDAPTEVLEALVPLAQKHPAETLLVERALEGLQQTQRWADWVDLTEKRARTEGGLQNAEALMEAAQVASDTLGNVQAAEHLREEAGKLHPDNVRFLKWKAEKCRQASDTPQLVDVLQRLLAQTANIHEACNWRLELAEALASTSPRRALVEVETVLQTEEAINSKEQAQALLQTLLQNWPPTDPDNMAVDLSMSTRRRVAEILSAKKGGASLAASLWPSLLRGNPVDAQAWSGFAQALTLAGQSEYAGRAQALAALLQGEVPPREEVKPSTLSMALEGLVAPKRAVVPIQEDTMPHLHAFLQGVLTAMGADGKLVPMLDVEGGLEAYQAAPNLLVVGALALSYFDREDLKFLLALALSLGPQGHYLTEPGVVPGISYAAVEAFTSYASVRAAGRVLALLDERVRGADPQTVDVAAILRQSRPFMAVARRLLESFPGA